MKISMRCTVELELGARGEARLVDVLADRVYEESKGGSSRLQLEPYGYRWLRLEGRRG
jgi:hypothetical protein